MVHGIVTTLMPSISAHCASLPLDDSTGFVAYYVTNKSWRGKGIGREVFDLSCKALGKRQLTINADFNLQGMYAAGGFNLSTFCLVTYEGSIKDLKIGKDEYQKEEVRVSTVKDFGFQKIMDYDQKIHPMVRTKPLKWFTDFSHVALVLTEGNVMKGWGSLYKADRGFRLMPLYADSPKFARILLHELLKSVTTHTDAGIEVAFPEDNKKAQEMFEEVGMTKRIRIQRMFNERDVPLPYHLVYSVLNLHNVLG